MQPSLKLPLVPESDEQNKGDCAPVLAVEDEGLLRSEAVKIIGSPGFPAKLREVLMQKMDYDMTANIGLRFSDQREAVFAISRGDSPEEVAELLEAVAAELRANEALFSIFNSRGTIRLREARAKAAAEDTEE